MTPTAFFAIAVPAVALPNRPLRNIRMVRIFSFDRTRARYINLPTIIDWAFGGIPARPGPTFAAT